MRNQRSDHLILLFLLIYFSKLFTKLKCIFKKLKGQKNANGQLVGQPWTSENSCCVRFTLSANLEPKSYFWPAGTFWNGCEDFLTDPVCKIDIQVIFKIAKILHLWPAKLSFKKLWLLNYLNTHFGPRLSTSIFICWQV